MGYDVFISYRREGAEAHAKMLHRDLVDLGYTVFYDMDSMGGGDYLDMIYSAIDACNDVIVLLSKDALGEKLHAENDVMAKELGRALQKNKHIMGIMLNGFDQFPADIPPELASLSRVNCVSGRMEYYDAMIQKLTSGRFLMRPSKTPEKECDNGSKVDTLKWFKQLPFTEKSAYMRLLLNLQHEFNSSPECMRLYYYLDQYFRDLGIRQTPPYNGVIPTDIVTYLSFFETFYLMLISQTLDISLIDEMFRFRFFAMVNNPFVQQSELLPLGDQYPNILFLYDLWLEHIRHVNEGSDTGAIQDSVYLYENDLHKRYRAYSFMMRHTPPVNVVFLNRKWEKKELYLRRLDMADYEAICIGQNTITQEISDRRKYAPPTEQELRRSLGKDTCVGLFDGDTLAAFLSVITSPDESTDLSLDLMEYQSCEAPAVLDCVYVLQPYRGYGIQRFLIGMAAWAGERDRRSHLFATVSPLNPTSSVNFLKSGFQLASVRDRYGSPREYYVYELRKGER